LNQYVFANDQEAQEIIEAWRNEYTQYRPQSSLGYQTPAEFAAQAAVNHFRIAVFPRRGWLSGDRLCRPGGQSSAYFLL